MRKSKRVISKSKTYGFNPWVDQVDAITQVMEESGEKTESVVLRKLIDEALVARRKKSPFTVASEPLPISASAETLEALQTLLLKLVRQGETSLRIQDVNLALLQDVLAESRAGRKIVWDALAAPALSEKGMSADQVERQFDNETREAKNYAYGVADELKRTQN